MTVTLTEAEARLLSAIVLETIRRAELTQEQSEALSAVASKFYAAGQAAVAGLVERHGFEEASSIAADILARHPHIDELVFP